MGHESNQEDRVCVASVGDAERLARAEGWLSSVAEHPEGIADNEAVIYLRSRGHDCHKQVIDIVESWKIAERIRLDQLSERKAELHEKGISVDYISQMEPRGFWEATPLGEYSAEATMLRTVEWCAISGFDSWWLRLAKTFDENRLRRGIEEPACAAYWLFNMLRSDYAIRLMPRVLNGYSQSMSLVGPGDRAPWTLAGEGASELHLAQASAIVFAHHRLGAGISEWLLREAVATLCKFQDKAGAWTNFTSDPDFSIESTAMALHALALAQPRDWPRIARGGRDWLWSKQGEDGFWTEPGTPGPAHLTVLVLDAIALANGGTKLTFGAVPGYDMSRGIDHSSEDLPLTELAGDPTKAELDLNGQSEEALENDERLSTPNARRAAVKRYREEVERITGKRITKKDFWTVAGYKFRSEFERWERAAPTATNAAHQAFLRILREKPHLKQ